MKRDDNMNKTKDKNAQLALAKDLLRSPEKAYEIINSYIDLKFKPCKTYKTALKNFDLLEKFLGLLDFVPDIDVIIELLSKNEKFKDAVLKIIKHLQSGSNTLSDECKSELVIRTIEVYYMINDIETVTSNPQDKNRNDYHFLDTYETDYIYFREVGQIPLLTLEEEQSLAKRIASGDAEAKRELEEKNLKLVIHIAMGYRGLGMPLLDLIQEGNMGLMIAAERYDLNKKCRFSTYATWWIRKAITRALAEKSRLIRLPVYLSDRIEKCNRAIQKLTTRLNRPPSDEEVAEESGLSVANIKTCLNIAEAMILSNEEIADMLSHEKNTFEEMLIDNSVAQPMHRIIANSDLNEQELRIIILRYGLSDGVFRTLQEVGEICHLTRQRIGKIEADALKKLRDNDDIRDLAVYLYDPKKALDNLDKIQCKDSLKPKNMRLEP